MNDNFTHKEYNTERLMMRIMQWPEAVRYFHTQIIRGLAKGTIAKNLCDVLAFLTYHNRPLKRISPDDVHAWLMWTKGSYLTSSTFSRRAVTVKSFLKGIEREDLAKAVPKIKQKYEPKCKLLTDEDIRGILSVCKNDLERILINMLWDTGCRVGEILTLRKKNITLDDTGIFIVVNGKTGTRPVRITRSRKHVEGLYKSLNNPDDLAFQGKGYNWAYWIFRRAMPVLKKRVHPHMFRHTKATEMWKVLPDQITKKHLGFSKDSKMARHYEHFSLRDIDEAFTRNGIIQPGS